MHRYLMARIHATFSKLFDELQAHHVALRERVNGFREQGVELEERLKEEMERFERWRWPIMDSLGEITQGFDGMDKASHQEYVRNTLYYQIVQDAPFYWRIMNKPNGYAGDAMMMAYIYRDQFEGDTPFGMLLHKHAVSTKACQSVRNRKELLTNEILKTGGGRILSLAAGPAQEIREILVRFEEDTFQFVALDHDMETLKKFNMSDTEPRFTYALANAFQIISGNFRTAKPRKTFERWCVPRLDFKGLRSAFAYVKYNIDYLFRETFDMVYSAGLYDYIKTFELDDSKGTVALTTNLFSLVKPGGSIVVGNFNQNNPRDLRFVMEYVYDWQLIHRDRNHMMEFARGIPEDHIEEIQVLDEPLGINYFLKITKKESSPNKWSNLPEQPND